MKNKVKSTRVKEVITRDAKLAGLAVAGILAVAIVSYLIQAFPVAFDVVAYSIILGMVPVMYVGTVRMRAKAPSSKFNRGFAFNQVREFCRKGITNTRFIAEKTGLPISEIEKIQESYFQKFNKKHGIFQEVASDKQGHRLVIGAQTKTQANSKVSAKTKNIIRDNPELPTFLKNGPFALVSDGIKGSDNSAARYDLAVSLFKKGCPFYKVAFITGLSDEEVCKAAFATGLSAEKVRQLKTHLEWNEERTRLVRKI